MVLALLIGIPLGVLSSLLAWWILFHVTVPRVRFDSRIVPILKPTPSGTSYFAMTNTGKRPIIDCSVRAELRVRGLDPEGPPGATWLFNLPLRHHHFLRWPPQTRRFAVVLPYRFSTEDSPLLSKFADTAYSLEQLLSTVPSATVRFAVFAYDSFSGTRRLFLSDELDASSFYYALNSVEPPHAGEAFERPSASP